MKSVLVIGDLILDELWYTNVYRLSPEAPIPTAELKTTAPSSLSLGGAGLTARLVADLGYKTTLLTSLSPLAEKLVEESSLNVGQTLQLSLECDTNVTKTRFIDDQNGYHLLRLDNDQLADNPWAEVKKPCHLEVISRIQGLLADNKAPDVCLLSDYVKNFFPGREWGNLLQFLHSKQIPTLLDSKSKGLTPWRHCAEHSAWIKLNNHEFNDFSKYLTSSEVITPPEELLLDIDITDRLLVTRGKEGASLYMKESDSVYIAHAKPGTDIVEQENIPDVTGCGDAFDARFITALAEGAEPDEALSTAVNYASRFAITSIKRKLQ